MLPITLVFHAEKLHDERVWRRVERVARWLAVQGCQATFFVYPFRAQMAGQDITNRVRALATLGHEIGQHTHFYAGTKLDKAEKVDDLSAANLVQCLHRDYETLRCMGYAPQAFTAGAWLVNETVLDTLVALGFTYDCSARFPKPQGTTSSPHHRWLSSPQLYNNAHGRLLCLPTTCSLGEWWKWGRSMQAIDYGSYQMIYTHDYDLLSLRTYLLLWSFLVMTRRRRLVSASLLVKRLWEDKVHD